MNKRADLPPLNWLKTFEAAARLLNFSAAGRELYLTQSAVSQQIRLLEHHLGEPLFVREHRTVYLTNSGMAYLPVVQSAISNLQRHTSDIFSPLGKGRLVIEVNIAFSIMWLSPRLSRFCAQYPGLKLQLVHANWDNEFNRSPADITIIHGNGDWSGMQLHPLFTPELTPYCAPKLAHQLSDPSDLLCLPLLEVLGNRQGWQGWFQQAAIDTANADILYHKIDNLAAGMSMVASGLGVFLSYPDFFTDQSDSQELLAPFDICLKTEENYYLAYPKGMPLSKSATVFKEWVLSELGLHSAIKQPPI
ncbi:LysR substrate-binding domain-containing protein [Psychrobacter sp. 72-O-c]|uniref:LysR substrate-binding domain-containing protein n=1 Tax=Psychrobacter sp. 72-O-c TaxID=2774125 RepID=UPI00191B0B81|nr:LysR substrate-binding domain-containing protein [Psychrobacter sp. 72-O-c]